MGEGALAGGPHHLAGRQAHHPAGRGPARQPELLVRLVVRRVHHGRHAGARPHRTLQRPARPLQGRRLPAAKENGYNILQHLRNIISSHLI